MAHLEAINDLEMRRGKNVLKNLIARTLKETTITPSLNLKDCYTS